jgi:RNA polymerase sigma factor (sigma-70 family)
MTIVSGSAPERELVLAARQGDGDARGRLVDEFLPLIGSVAHVYRRTRGVHRDELLQEGVVGLLRALERYDPELGTPFWAYAAWWVRQAMQQLVAELSRPVVLSDRALRQLAHVRDVRHEYVRDHGREPTRRALADASGLKDEQLDSLLVAEREPRSLEEPIGGIAGTAMTFGDLISDPRSEESYDDVSLRVGVPPIPGLMRCLSEREESVVRARFGLGEQPRTFPELASVLGVSSERVRQIEQAALQRMREGMLAQLTGAHDAADDAARR